MDLLRLLPESDTEIRIYKANLVVSSEADFIRPFYLEPVRFACSPTPRSALRRELLLYMVDTQSLNSLTPPIHWLCTTRAWNKMVEAMLANEGLGVIPEAIRSDAQNIASFMVEPENPPSELSAILLPSQQLSLCIHAECALIVHLLQQKKPGNVNL